MNRECVNLSAYTCADRGPKEVGKDLFCFKISHSALSPLWALDDSSGNYNYISKLHRLCGNLILHIAVTVMIKGVTD